MKHTAAFIDAFCAREGISAKEIAARMGLDPTLFAGWRKGKAEHVRLGTLVNMQSGISDDRREQARLLIAYLRDQCVGPANGQVEIRLRELEEEAARVQEEPALSASTTTDAWRPLLAALRETQPDGKMRTCLEKLIRALPGSRHLRKALLAIAEMQEDNEG